VVCNLAVKNQINFVRFGSKETIPIKSKVRSIVHFFHGKNKKHFPKNLFSTEHWVSLDWIGDMELFLNHLPEGKTEIVCHPERREEFELIKKYF
jgi:hypothetical protein